ncbi:metaxin-2-like isoform X3 [Cimex lectularius]|uniref:Metaxin-2 n=1 Tax=Cimex lectularius TaxID=79782 RepID=A0A8I6SQP8_CIMLE|nr:metaxin-2-like isoform X3 [Cimex lectularius]
MFFKKNQNKTDSYCTKKNSCEKLSSYDKSGNVYKNILNPGNVSIINEKNLEATVMGQEPWPEDAKLFQPYETEQILLPDSANCLAVQAFLKMCQLNYTVEYKVNAEEMSPSGKVPFIKCGAYLISELESITNFVASKGISLTSNLDESQKADMRAYMSLVNIVLGNAENYVTWCDNETYLKVTKPRYGSVHPFPLNHILCYLKRKSILKRLAVYGWADKTLDKVYDEVDRGCSALSERLEKSRFFFGDKPTELDALVFGHVYTILATPLPNNRFAATVRGYTNLLDHCMRIERQLFNGGDAVDINLKAKEMQKLYEG